MLRKERPDAQKATTTTTTTIANDKFSTMCNQKASSKSYETAHDSLRCTSEGGSDLN